MSSPEFGLFPYLRRVLSLENISYDIGGRFLFKDASLQIKPGDKIGLVGRNGTGKTTLLRLITSGASGLQGNISMPKNLKIGFLDQELQSRITEKTVLGVAMEAFDELITLKHEIEELLGQVNKNPDLVQKLSQKQQEFEIRGGYDMDSRAASLLSGLGFSETDQQMPFKTFSGGWRMRAILAKLLLQEPDLLLLDEPTNHLDLPSIEWLEEYLRNFRGAFLIVSHDRYFLDRLAETIVELAHGKFVRYSGNYTFFLKEKAERQDLQKREYENQQRMISDTEKFINRFRAKATKAKQVQSKIKLLEKLERIAPPEEEAGAMNLTFRAATTPGKQIIHLEIEGKAYGPKEVLKSSDVTIFRGDKIALIGANGIGKSTVLRMVAGTEPFDGEKRDGHNVEKAFFAQHQLEALTPSNTILSEMSKFSHEKGEGFVRNILGSFLFSGDDVEKKIQVLSGGEKSRVALAKTLLTEANFLLLDEPTNHLDIQSIQILVQALQQYEGTYICISHDRFFLEKIANKIWYIENKVLKSFPGTYEEFEYHRKNKNGSAPKPKSVPINQPAKPKSDEKSGKEAYQEEKRRKQRFKRIAKEVETAEELVMELETEKEQLLQEMAKPENATEFEQLSKLQKQYDQVLKRIEKETENWESLVLEQEELIEEFGESEI